MIGLDLFCLFACVASGANRSVQEASWNTRGFRRAAQAHEVSAPFQSQLLLSVGSHPFAVIGHWAQSSIGGYTLVNLRIS